MTDSGRGWPPSAKAFRAIATPIGQGMQLGADLQHGLYLDAAWQPTQRFRWIEPGEFLMGSPEDEEGRDASEGPQHVVRLDSKVSGWQIQRAAKLCGWR